MTTYTFKYKIGKKTNEIRLSEPIIRLTGKKSVFYHGLNELKTNPSEKVYVIFEGFNKKTVDNFQKYAIALDKNSVKYDTRSTNDLKYLKEEIGTDAYEFLESIELSEIVNLTNMMSQARVSGAMNVLISGYIANAFHIEKILKDIIVPIDPESIDEKIINQQNQPIPTKKEMYTGISANFETSKRMLYNGIMKNAFNSEKAKKSAVALFDKAKSPEERKAATEFIKSVTRFGNSWAVDVFDEIEWPHEKGVSANFETSRKWLYNGITNNVLNSEEAKDTAIALFRRAKNTEERKATTKFIKSVTRFGPGWSNGVFDGIKLSQEKGLSVDFENIRKWLRTGIINKVLNSDESRETAIALFEKAKNPEEKKAAKEFIKTVTRFGNKWVEDVLNEINASHEKALSAGFKNSRAVLQTGILDENINSNDAKEWAIALFKEAENIEERNAAKDFIKTVTSYGYGWAAKVLESIKWLSKQLIITTDKYGEEKKYH